MTVVEEQQRQGVYVTGQRRIRQSRKPFGHMVARVVACIRTRGAVGSPRCTTRHRGTPLSSEYLVVPRAVDRILHHRPGSKLPRI